MAWHGMAWHGMAWHGMTTLAVLWQELANPSAIARSVMEGVEQLSLVYAQESIA